MNLLKVFLNLLQVFLNLLKVFLNLLEVYPDPWQYYNLGFILGAAGAISEHVSAVLGKAGAWITSSCCAEV